METFNRYVWVYGLKYKIDYKVKGALQQICIDFGSNLVNIHCEFYKKLIRNTSHRFIDSQKIYVFGVPTWAQSQNDTVETCWVTSISMDFYYQ